MFIILALYFWFQVFQGAGMQKYKLPDDVPSAPPLAGSFSEINQVSEQLRADFSPRRATSDGSATADVPTAGNGTPLDFTAKRACDASVRYVVLASKIYELCGVVCGTACVLNFLSIKFNVRISSKIVIFAKIDRAAGASSNSLPAKFPTFHAR